MQDGNIIHQAHAVRNQKIALPLTLLPAFRFLMLASLDCILRPYPVKWHPSSDREVDIFESQELSLQSVAIKRRFQIVIMATGEFAVPSMRALCESEMFEIVCLVTGPMRCDKTGRPIITPARQVADEYGLPISDQEDVNSTEFCEFLYLVRPDLIFVCDFGQILSRQTLSGSILGGINLHGSLLPKFRGAAPVHWAILSGEHYTGVSVIHMTPKIDAGPVIAQSPQIPIGTSENVVELECRLAQYGAQLVYDTIAKMAQNETIRIIEQLHDRVSKAPRLKKEDGLVSWNQSSQAIFNQYRATIPWPRIFTDWQREDGSTLRLILGKIVPLRDSLTELAAEQRFEHDASSDVDMTDAKMDNLANLRATPRVVSAERNIPAQRPAWWEPGTVIQAGEGILIIAAREGAVRIEQIQPAGRKMMQTHDFLRGYCLKPGERFGKADDTHCLTNFS